LCEIQFKAYHKLFYSLGNLTEIFLDDKSMSKINEVDLKIIQIFNSYKKNQFSFRKRKLKNLFKKRLAKKKFFKIKRPTEEKISIEEKPKLVAPKEQIPKIPSNLNLNEQTNCTSLMDIDSCVRRCICKKLEDISLMNKLFITNFINLNFEYESTMRSLHTFLCYSFLVSKSFRT
jgi:hypothetical protein